MAANKLWIHPYSSTQLQKAESLDINSPQLVKNLTAFYCIWRFIAVLTKARSLSLYVAWWIQSTVFQLILQGPAQY
jgi:hypothetical protein